MSVHYKFKSALDFDTITFDGLHISVNDLKKSIVQQKRLGKTADFDLQITNAQTKEEYSDNSTLIPKNTSLIIARIPLSSHPKKVWDPQAEKIQHHRSVAEPERGDLDLSQMNGTEEDKIQAMMAQSTVDYDPNKYQKLRGQGQTGEVPPSYRCFKCHKPGHWIKNCPNNIAVEIEPAKRNTGIPRSFLQDKENQEKLEEIPPPIMEKKQEIPEDLICSICKDLFTDAVMIPCCGSSFCDECVRTALLESEDNECPDCKEKGSSPGSLIPNRFLRNSVNSFKNETGYSKPKMVKDKPKEPVLQVIEEKNKEKESPPDISNKKENKKDNEVTGERLVQESTEKKHDPHSSHDEIESDFEDNITVTVPPPHMQSHRPYHERSYNGSRHSRHPKPPGMESSPKYQVSPSQDSERILQQSEEQIGHDHINEHHKQQQFDPHLQTNPRDPSIRPHRPPGSDMYGNMQQPMNPYAQNMAPQMQHTNQIRPPYNNPGYGMHQPTGYMQPYPMGDNRVRGPYPMNRPPYGGPMPPRPRHMGPSPNLASVYQGVQAKVGTGIIDDPLEAFNRIMREKEKRKEERRRSPDRRRSRSIEVRSRIRSPGIHHSRIRHDDRRMRSPFFIKDRRIRSPRRDRRPNEIEKRRRRSRSFSDRSRSRSRSWSNPLPSKRRSKTPVNIRRRSRTHSRSYSVSRSRSRSHSKGRYRGSPLAPRGYNRSPLRSVSPRYRQKENRGRHEGSRDASPYHSARRPRSRQRSPANQYHRQEKPSGYEHFSNFQNPSPPSHEVGYHDKAPKRYSRERQLTYNRNEHYDRPRENEYKPPQDRYDDAPPGTVEPPPPGFESSPPPVDRSWEPPFIEHDKYRRIDNPRYDDRNRSPDILPNPNLRPINEERPRERRSWSKTSVYSPKPVQPEKRRRSRSRTPLRIETVAENLSSRPVKDKTRERSAERHEKYRTESKKYEKTSSSKDKKTETSSREKVKEKLVEKENIKVSKEKEKEKEKEKKIIEKEKRHESSEDDKKDKKIKERKKKKKDREEKETKKKIKKEKKEKEKKIREKSKNRDEEDEGEEEEGQQTDQKFVAAQSEPDSTVMEQEKETNVQESNELIPPIEIVNKQIADFSSASPQDQQNNAIDLYADICPGEDIKFDYINNVTEDGEIVDDIDDVNNAQPPQYNRFDSILDIHDFETGTDLDALTTTVEQTNKNPQMLAELPVPSKWELDEDTDEKKNMIDAGSEKVDEAKVTSEVLKRAENAIFTRAINAIRPIEIKKVSSDRQKLYNDSSPSDERQSIQVTVPVLNKIRSVELKEEKKSIKDRLGVKILDVDPVDYHRSSTPPTNRFNSVEALNNGRNRSKSRERRRSRDRYDGRSKDRNRSKDTVDDTRLSKPRDRYRESDRNKSPVRRDELKDKKVDERKRTDHSESKSRNEKRYAEKKRDRSSRSLSLDRKRHKHEEKKAERKEIKEKYASEITKPKQIEVETSKKDKKFSSSSSSSDSEDSGSDDNSSSKKKKRKHKKEKKRSRRSSSTETKSSAKRKRSKSKKKNKASKKKKKNKK